MRPTAGTFQRPMLVLSCSLRPESRSHQLAVAAESALRARAVTCELIDLREWDLPFCDGDDSYNHPSVSTLRDKVAGAPAILIASPVYNYGLNAAAKNIVELTGQSWLEKPVGLLCAAGGHHSYMAPIGLANSLMFDFRCHIVPRYVYATKDDFTPSGELVDGIRGRVDQLAQAAVDLAAALAWIRSQA